MARDLAAAGWMLQVSKAAAIGLISPNMLADIRTEELEEYEPRITPRVAVLMATYGGDDPAHLKAALATLYAQTYPREAIRIYFTIDGPIPPENLIVIETAFQQFGERGLCITELRRNVGLGAALNAAAAKFADEEFIIRADADDLSDPLRIALQVAHMITAPTVDILGTAIVEFSEASGTMGQRTYPKTEHVRNYLAYASPLAHPTVCFRRNAWEHLGGYRSVSFNEDLDMWFRAAASGLRIDNLDQALVHFRLSAGLIQRRSWPKAFAEFICYLRGIHSLFGWSWRLLIPFLRLALRLMPAVITQYVYTGSTLRRNLLNTKRR